MINLADFSESLRDLMLDRGIEAPILARIINVHENSVYRYLSGVVAPTLDTAIRLANFFECSIEYLLGRDENRASCFSNQLPSFSEQLRYLFAYFKSNEYRLHKEAKISRSITHAWLHKNATPTLENLAKIADYYDCTIDFVIGRKR